MSSERYWLWLLMLCGSITVNAEVLGHISEETAETTHLETQQQPESKEQSKLIYRVICTSEEVLPDCAQELQDTFNSDPVSAQLPSENSVKNIEPVPSQTQPAVFNTDPVPDSLPSMTSKHKQSHKKPTHKAEKKIHHAKKHKK